jgi:hypothetical protein
VASAAERDKGRTAAEKHGGGKSKGTQRGGGNDNKVKRGQNARGGAPYIGPGAATWGGGED